MQSRTLETTLATAPAGNAPVWFWAPILAGGNRVTTLTERIPLSDINRQAAEVKTGHAVLTAIAAVFFAAGWLAGRVLPVLMWCCFAVREGFRSAHGPSRKMQITALQAEIGELRIQLSRFSG